MLADAGFEPLGAPRFPTEHRWTADELVGYVYSTSFLPRHTLGPFAADFEADLRSALDRFGRNADLWQIIDFAYELFRRPTDTT